MIVYSWLKRDFRNIHKKYSVGGGATRMAKADTLAEAKRAGLVIAKRELWRGKWNLLWVSVEIHTDSGNHVHYNSTGWKMYVPVRGSGKSADYILAELKRRHGVKPLVWTKK